MVEDAPLTRGPAFPTFLMFAWPLAGAMAFHGLFNCVDLIIVGRLGPGAVAAVTIGGIINMVAMLAFNGVANVIAAKAARRAGAGDIAALSVLDATASSLTWKMSVGVGLVFAIAAGPVVDAFGVDEQTESSSYVYLIILSLGSGTMFFLLLQSALLRAVGNSMHPMIALVGANILNLGLDVVLVFGIWGFPQLGVVGAAWATVFSRLLGALFLGRILKKRRRSWPKRGGNPQLCAKILKSGCTHSMQMIVRVASIYGLIVIAASALPDQIQGSLGARDLLDGVGVGIRLEMVLLFASLGWGTAAAAYVGQNLGAGQYGRARNGALAAVTAALASGLAVSAVLFCWPHEILRFVAPQATGESVRYGVDYLRIIVWGHPGLIVAIVLSQTLVALKSVWAAVLLDTGLYLALSLPLSSVAVFGGENASRVWWVVMSIHLISAPLYLLLFRKRFLKEKQKEAATCEPVP